jgi:hypothetical protein
MLPIIGFFAVSMARYWLSLPNNELQRALKRGGGGKSQNFPHTCQPVKTKQLGVWP